MKIHFGNVYSAKTDARFTRAAVLPFVSVSAYPSTPKLPSASAARISRLSRMVIYSPSLFSPFMVTAIS